MSLLLHVSAKSSFHAALPRGPKEQQLLGHGCQGPLKPLVLPSPLLLFVSFTCARVLL
ncbi:hypothetical protein EXN66_Car019643 [Channa argus]|uniref:Uncharacterized protein n=1 Tax=Channa argus TaxID=215402 RepID=A0A6G1QN29_CHAAH|nr:hypothetical protein EXN66_Car019643 [Channa argus]